MDDPSRKSRTDSTDRTYSEDQSGSVARIDCLPSPNRPDATRHSEHQRGIGNEFQNRERSLSPYSRSLVLTKANINDS